MVSGIKRISMCNFKGFPSDYITHTDFDKQLNILSGPNGFGKTTIFDAIELIFSHEMTRFNGLENGNQKFENHLLLNDPSKKGFLCIDVIDDSDNTKQYAAIISNSKSHKFVSVLAKTITYYAIENENIIENWNEIISSDVIQHIETRGIEVKNPLIDNFNVCYYVSQEESTHLLKLPIRQREDTLSPLIGKELLEDKYNLFKESAALFIYDETRINEIINEIRSLNYDEEIQPVTYQQLFPDKSLNWDSNQLVADKTISSYISSLKKLKMISPYVAEIKQYYINRKIGNLVRDTERNQIVSIMYREGIKDSDELIKTISQSKVKYDKTKELVSSYEQLEQLLSQEILKINKVETLIKRIDNMKNIISENDYAIIDISKNAEQDFSSLSSLLKKRKTDLELQDKISNEKMNLEQSRKNIIEHLESYTQLIDINETHCPLCNSKFDSFEELEEDISRVGQVLESISVKEDSDLEENWENISEIFSRIKSDFSQLDPQNYVIDWKSVDIEKYIEDQTKINQLDQLLDFIRDKRIDIETDNNWIEEIKSLRKELKEDFLRVAADLNLESVINDLGVFLEINTIGSLINFIEETDSKLIDTKIDYLVFLQRSSENTKYQDLMTKLNALVKEKLQWEKMITTYRKIDQIIKANEKKLKKTIVEAIRIPLLVYTAKMLQNYQGGLGVYIDDNALRFISSENQPDILNKFSSGQLSAFILTFLLLMNKLYVNDGEQYQFLLVDDPVQTMDEINLSSFVDVLRREFQDKQIILSTHEEDKKNYIGYKFIKNGSTVKVINVKDEWY